MIHQGPLYPVDLIDSQQIWATHEPRDGSLVSLDQSDPQHHFDLIWVDDTRFVVHTRSIHTKWWYHVQSYYQLLEIDPETLEITRLDTAIGFSSRASEVWWYSNHPGAEKLPDNYSVQDLQSSMRVFGDGDDRLIFSGHQMIMMTVEDDEAGRSYTEVPYYRFCMEVLRVEGDTLELVSRQELNNLEHWQPHMAANGSSATYQLAVSDRSYMLMEPRRFNDRWHLVYLVSPSRNIFGETDIWRKNWDSLAIEVDDAGQIVDTTILRVTLPPGLLSSWGSVPNPGVAAHDWPRVWGEHADWTGPTSGVAVLGSQVAMSPRDTVAVWSLDLDYDPSQRALTVGPYRKLGETLDVFDRRASSRVIATEPVTIARLHASATVAGGDVVVLNIWRDGGAPIQRALSPGFIAYRALSGDGTRAFRPLPDGWWMFTWQPSAFIFRLVGDDLELGTHATLLPRASPDDIYDDPAEILAPRAAGDLAVTFRHLPVSEYGWQNDRYEDGPAIQDFGGLVESHRLAAPLTTLRGPTLVRAGFLGGAH